MSLQRFKLPFKIHLHQGFLHAITGASFQKKNPTFTWDQVLKHSKEDDLWLVIGGKVYDVTPFVSSHPGGQIML